MQFNLKKPALLAAWIIFAEGSVYPQDAIDKVQALVGTSARRLAIAEQVALAKWDNGMPVEDASLEEHVIVSAAKAGQSRGLDPTSVSNFFRAQIEANKLVQYSLLAEWHRVGKAPDRTPVDLASTIRPELDEVDRAFDSEHQAVESGSLLDRCTPQNVHRGFESSLSVTFGWPTYELIHLQGCAHVSFTVTGYE